MRRLRALLLFAFAPLAAAHDLWIEPSSFRPAIGERVSVALRIGQNLHGEPMPRIPQLIDRFVLHDTTIGGRPGLDPAGVIAVIEPGLQWIGYQSNAYPLSTEAAKFEAYLREEGLERISAERARRKQSAIPGNERYYRCAKALLDVAGNSSANASQSLGFMFELVPRTNPYALRAGDKLPIALTFRGKPIANVLVIAMRKGAPAQVVRARTDAQGRASLKLDADDFWLIKAVHMEAAPAGAGVDWESWWASMTFDLRGRRAQ